MFPMYPKLFHVHYSFLSMFVLVIFFHNKVSYITQSSYVLCKVSVDTKLANTETFVLGKYRASYLEIFSSINQ